MVENSVLLGTLAVLAWIDLKKEALPLPLLAGVGAVGMVFFGVTKEPPFSSLLGGICVGGVLLLGALVSRESIGFGDGLLLAVTGIYLGLWKNLMLLFVAVSACALFGLVLVLRGKYARRQRLPFAPFVLASDVALLIFMM